MSDGVLVYQRILQKIKEKMEVLVGESATLSILRASWRLVKKEYTFLERLDLSTFEVSKIQKKEIEEELLQKGLQEFLDTVMELFSDLVGEMLSQKLEELILKYKERAK